jgi:hypothetical protein
MKCAAVALTALSATVLTVPAASAQPRSHPDGRVCLFDAPKAPLHLGHIGWAYRWSADPGQWDYGATVDARHGWRKHGSFQQMLADFRKSHDAEGYSSFRCKNTPAADQRDADAVASLVNGKGYNIMVDNCLTKSIRIIKAYDESGGLNALPAGHWTAPNYYYTQILDKAGWDRLIRLR